MDEDNGLRQKGRLAQVRKSHKTVTNDDGSFDISDKLCLSSATHILFVTKLGGACGNFGDCLYVWIAIFCTTITVQMGAINLHTHQT